jgi:3D (Asp-Asp-Asp) domain-containing protein
MKNRRISRRIFALRPAKDGTTQRREIVRTVVAVTMAIALIGTGAVALPSLAPAISEASVDIPPLKGPKLEPEEVASTVSDLAKDLPSKAASVARATTAVTRPIADGMKVIPSAVGLMRATAHEAIKMKKGILPLIPSKFARAENGVMIPVSLTQYCVQGETRRGRQTRHGIVAADPRIFPLARYVEVFLGSEYLGRYLVDDTGGNVLGATLDIWNPDCREAARFGRHWGSAILVAREVEQVPNDSLTPTRWDGLAKR